MHPAHAASPDNLSSRVERSGRVRLTQVVVGPRAQRFERHKLGYS